MTTMLPTKARGRSEHTRGGDLHASPHKAPVLTHLSPGSSTAAKRCWQPVQPGPAQGESLTQGGPACGRDSMSRTAGCETSLQLPVPEREGQKPRSCRSSSTPSVALVPGGGVTWEGVRGTDRGAGTGCYSTPTSPCTGGTLCRGHSLRAP